MIASERRLVMALNNLNAWAEDKAPAACGTACGAADKDEAPAACGAAEAPAACGAADKEEAPAACGSACGVGDK